MVSSAVEMEEKKVVAALKGLKARHSKDPEYKRLRKDLPRDWPI
jgi:hypothetical protein